MANNTYNDGGFWNRILNSLPKKERPYFKLSQVAQVERSKVGTSSYRVLNYYAGTDSPTQGHPWSTANNASQLEESILLATITNLNITNGSNVGNFTVAHGLGMIPNSAVIQMTAGGFIWLQNPKQFDATNLYLTASGPNLTATAVIVSSLLTP